MTQSDASELVEIVQSGDIRASLEAIRDNLAGRLETAYSRDAAGIAKQLQEVIERLELIEDEEEASDVDDLQAAYRQSTAENRELS
ncbi:hypothetical protein O7630_06670 [Micromonospora sp. WMMD718]|uniref:hypothetical protein n=1 Tax=unclassified Micromonospora TaxID=2617518 RepID=UPI00128D90F4|nr:MULTISPECIES: hypothetical protein [unclassified Micromonospora]MDG4750614.1 hypothetical protein [Micromonospora sp. WMMD718]